MASILSQLLKKQADIIGAEKLRSIIGQSLRLDITEATMLRL